MRARDGDGALACAGPASVCRVTLRRRFETVRHGPIRRLYAPVDGPRCVRRGRAAGHAAVRSAVQGRARVSWLAVIALAAVVAVTTSLGLWQLRRAGEKRHLEAVRTQALAAAPVPLDATPRAAGELVDQRIAARGRWLKDRTIFLDNRTHAGQAGFFVFTPLALARPDAPAAMADDAGARSVLVLRGWVAGDPADRTRVPVIDDDGSREVTVVGIGEREVANTMLLGRDDAQGRLWQQVSLPRFATWSGLALQPVILRQLEPDRGTGPGAGAPVQDMLVRDWDSATGASGMTAERHVGYAVQWFALAAMAIALGLWGRYGRRSTRMQAGDDGNGDGR